MTFEQIRELRAAMTKYIKDGFAALRNAGEGFNVYRAWVVVPPLSSQFALRGLREEADRFLCDLRPPAKVHQHFEHGRLARLPWDDGYKALVHVPGGCIEFELMAGIP